MIGALWVATLLPATTSALPRCAATSGNGCCIARRFEGSVADGELGFRFGEPLDADGDGHADVAAGARFKLQQGTLQNGSATVWSGATGKPLRTWDGSWPDGLFGHWVLPIPDISGDGRADVVVAAPTARVNDLVRGILSARSPQSGEEIWQRAGDRNENLGWDLDLAGDQNDDGRRDLFVGAPSADGGRVYLLSGKDGSLLHTYSPADPEPSFGWYVARVDDLDGDGRADLAVGAHRTPGPGNAVVGAAFVFSAATGKQLQHWVGTENVAGFGEVVAAIGDLDGDGHGEVVVAAPRTNDESHSKPGEVSIYSGATGKLLRHWTGRQAGELFGRMVVAAGDLDGDGIDDLAVGAPWYQHDAAARSGRVELRSGRSGAVIAELFGDGPDNWFGWHIRRAPDPAGKRRPALLISSLRHPVDGKPGVGVLDLCVCTTTGDRSARLRRSSHHGHLPAK